MTQTATQTLPATAYEHCFRTDHLMDDLKGRSIRGGVVTLSAQAVKFVLQMASTAVLARLLTPADFGLVAMVATFTGFIELFKDLGLSMATVQRTTITHAQVSVLFWINVAASVVLMAIAAALAPAVAWFYREPRLTGIMLVVAGTFLFGGLTAQHTALLRRQMRFIALATCEILSMAAGFAVAGLMAWWGFGYWSLVGMGAGTALVNMVLVWCFSSWRPGLPRRGAGVRAMLRFGGNLTGFNVINYFTRNADNVLIGRVWGATLLGQYDKAYKMLMMPIRQISAPLAAVAVPALSRLANSPERLRAAYLNIIEKIAIVTMPAMAFAMMMADCLVCCVLGPGWETAGRVFSWLAIAGMFEPVTTTTGWLFIVTGRAERMARWGLFGGTAAVLSFAAGLPFGPTGVAAAYALTFVLIRVPALFWYLGRIGPVGSLDFYRHLGPGAILAAAVIAGSFAVRHAAPHLSPVQTLGLSAVAASACVGLLLTASLRMRKALRAAFAL